MFGNVRQGIFGQLLVWRSLALSTQQCFLFNFILFLLRKFSVVIEIERINEIVHLLKKLVWDYASSVYTAYYNKILNDDMQNFVTSLLGLSLLLAMSAHICVSTCFHWAW